MRRQGIDHPRNVHVAELGLQGEGGGGDDHAPAGAQRRHQVGDALAGARTGLHEQMSAAVERPGDGLGHALLTGASLAARQRADDHGQQVGHGGFRPAHRGRLAASTGPCRARPQHSLRAGQVFAKQRPACPAIVVTVLALSTATRHSPGLSAISALPADGQPSAQAEGTRGHRTADLCPGDHDRGSAGGHRAVPRVQPGSFGADSGVDRRVLGCSRHPGILLGIALPRVSRRPARGDRAGSAVVFPSRMGAHRPRLRPQPAAASDHRHRRQDRLAGRPRHRCRWA